MAARLGEVIYWAASLIAALIFIAVVYDAFFGGGRADTLFHGSVIFVAILIWVFGFACRYVLADSKRDKNSN
jgi:hypothetical protein